MIENRIRELRKSHSLSQENFAVLLGTTQQTISRMETGVCDIPTDLLIKLASSFNVTTDYILGVSELKRDLSGHFRMNQEIDQYYDIILRYQKLNSVNRKTFQIILERIELTELEIRNLPQTQITQEGSEKNDTDSYM